MNKCQFQSQNSKNQTNQESEIALKSKKKKPKPCTWYLLFVPFLSKNPEWQKN